MTSTFTQGDTAPPLTGTVNADLTSTAVEVHLRKPGGVILTRTVTVTNATGGAWSYTWVTGDLDTPGVWDAEVQVTFTGGAIQTFGPVPFVVTPQIG